MDREAFTKVVASEEMAAIEEASYLEGCEEESFMEEAGRGVALSVMAFIAERGLQKIVTLIAGKGNNGGDAHVAGRYLIREGYSVTAYQIAPLTKCSPLCKKNYARLKEMGAAMREIESPEELHLPKEGVLVDALFGTGLKSAPREPYASIIKKVNSSDLPILSVDIPSGLSGGDGAAAGGAAVVADRTIYLGLPKRVFFLNGGWNFVGELRFVDFGLPKKYVEESASDMEMFSSEDFTRLLPPLVRNQHKYQAGYVVALAGSPAMPGAALLSTSAALRAGAGIVRLLHRRGMEGVLSASPYELIKTPYGEEEIEGIASHLERASALLIGPGIGMEESTVKMVKELLPAIEKAAVLDADALNIAAKCGLPLPKGSVITPHIGEMRRLLNSSRSGPVGEGLLEECQEFVEKREVTLVLKGGPTFVLHPGKPKVVVPYGNPGMATAGSGDVLTGIAAAMLAKGLPPRLAALLAVFAHARAGDFAEEALSAYAMIASDITRFLPEVFLRYGKKRALFTFSVKNFGRARGAGCSKSRRGNTHSGISEERFAADGASQPTENLTEKVNKAKKRNCS